MEWRLGFWQRVHLAFRLAPPPPPVVKPAPEHKEQEKEQDVTTWCPACFLAWEEQSDWHGLKPAGEAELCGAHMRRLLDFSAGDRGVAQKVILRLHNRAVRG